MIKMLSLDVNKLFNDFDINGDGVINGIEFLQMMKGYDYTLSDQELQDAFYEFD